MPDLSDPNTFVGPTAPAASGSSGSGFFSGLSNILSSGFNAGASAFNTKTQADLQSALGLQAKANAAAASNSSNNTVKIILYVVGGVVALGAIGFLVKMFRK